MRHGFTGETTMSSFNAANERRARLKRRTDAEGRRVLVAEHSGEYDRDEKNDGGQRERWQDDEREVLHLDREPRVEVAQDDDNHGNRSCEREGGEQAGDDEYRVEHAAKDQCVRCRESVVDQGGDDAVRDQERERRVNHERDEEEEVREKDT